MKQLIKTGIGCLAVLAVMFQLREADGADKRIEDDGASVELMKEKGAIPEIVYQSKAFFEGPAWDKASQKLFFTASGKENGKAFKRIMRLDGKGSAAVWMDNSGGVNGMFLDNDGQLLGAQYLKHKILSMVIGTNGPERIRVLAESDQWLQPNDVCQAVNGNIYFTDPDFKGQKQSKVYLLTPDGKVSPIIKDMSAPNGVILSPDGKILYVSDSFCKNWRNYPVLPDGTVGKGEIFFALETKSTVPPDGMTVDEKGNVYLTGAGGVLIVSPSGKLLEVIKIPEFCSNCTFGGKNNRTLFITASGKVYAQKMKVRGFR